MIHSGRYEGQPVTKPRKVFYTGDDALDKGIGLCYERDATSPDAATVASGWRDNRVELPNQSNNNDFAGVTAKAYRAVTGGQWIEIYEPGSVCEIAVGMDTVSGTTILTCSAGLSGDRGRFTWGGYMGRGTAKALQTVTALKESIYTGAAALDSAGVVLTDSAATFVTNGVAAGDRVYIIAGEDDGTNAATPGQYEVESVDSETQLTLTSAASDGGTMQVSYYVMTGNKRALAYLYDGPESGLQEIVCPDSPGHATADTFTIMGTGVTRLMGGVTIATGNSRAPLPNAQLGQTKAIICTGTLTTNDAEIELDTNGWQAKVLDEVTTGQTPQGAPLTMHALTFDAANEVAYLEFHGVWVEKYHTGGAIAAS